MCLTLLARDADTFKCDTMRNRENKPRLCSEKWGGREGGQQAGVLKECVATRWLRVMSATKSIYIPSQCRSTTPVEEDYYGPTPTRPSLLPPVVVNLWTFTVNTVYNFASRVFTHILPHVFLVFSLSHNHSFTFAHTIYIRYDSYLN